MSPARHKVGDLLRGDHRVVATHRGHFGVVYVCRQQLPGGKALYKAIKTFRSAGDRFGRALFDRELTNWVQLGPHPNVVQAKDADTVRNFLLLEFVPGPNLRDVCARHPIHPRHFLKWAREIAAGLRFLHEENEFVHRDLRPANVLIDTKHRLRAKISDLGIGKPYNPESSTHTVIGTFNFMAPEVHDGKTDYRSDIFSLGASLFHLLTGRYAVKLTTKDLTGVTSPDQYVPVPRQVVEVILKCLEVEPEKRYQHVDEFLAALEPIEEWKVGESAFEHCAAHDYSHFVTSRRPTCPFCVYDADFRRHEEELELALKRERESEAPPPEGESPPEPGR